MKSDWEKNGVTKIVNSRTNQIMPLEKVVYDDVIENEERLIALHRVKQLRVPSFFIHAREDEAVPYSNSEQLHIHSAAKDKELKLIAKAGHTFGISHPFEEDDFPKLFQALIDETIGWFRTHLR
jgi:esterase/lipase